MAPSSPAVTERPGADGAWQPGSQEDLAPAGARARVAANLAVVHTLAEITSEGRAATAAERQVLARWSGWGAVPGVFDESNERFAGERAELTEALGARGMAQAARSTLNAHYTDLGIVDEIWRVVGELGFTGGQVLEPGCGAGNFLHRAPIAAVVTAIEQEPTTASVAAALHPNAQVRAESFADTRLPDASFDLAIGNVPFAALVLHDRTHNSGRHSIHNHFLVKSLHLTRPGGLVCALTSRYTLDAANPAARREMAELADLVGAVRLPTGAHDRAAGTDVVTDLLVLRRRAAGTEPSGPSWERSAPAPGLVGPDGAEVRVNEYLLAHPEHILGSHTVGRGAYDAATLRVELDAGRLPDRLSAALDDITTRARAANLTWSPYEPGTEVAAGGRGRAAPGLDPTEAPEGLIEHVSGGSFTRVEYGGRVPLSVPGTQAAELRALLGLRDTLRELLDAESATVGDGVDMSRLRGELGARYDAYLAAHGPLNRFTLRSTGRTDPDTGEPRTRKVFPGQGGFRHDPFAPAVYGLEDFDEATGTAVKASIFAQRVIAPRTPRLGADTPADALAICLDTHGRVEIDTVAGLLGTDAADARRRLAGLVFPDPTPGPDDAVPEVGSARLIPAAEYLSGNVRDKLDAAQTAAESDPAWQPNVTALREVVPTDLTAAQIEARLGAAWIGGRHVQQFMAEVLDDPSAHVEHPGGSTWEVRGNRHGVNATQVWGTGRRPAPELIAALCEQRSIQVYDEVKTPDGSTRRVPNVTETLAAQEKATELAARFSEWVWEDPDRAGELAAVYNRTFNAIVLRSYDGSNLSLPGLAETFTPRPHQRDAVARMIAEPAVGLFHEVGAGKTAEMAMGCMELRRLGLVRKPAVVVPNNMLEQFGREFSQLYPQARLLVATREDLAGDKRREFVGRVSTGDYDAVIMTRGAFERLPLSGDNQKAYIEQESDRFRDWLEGLKASAEAGSGRGLTVKRMEKALAAAEERIKKALDKPRDPGLTFEQTGLDYLVVDEAHAYKNLRTPSNITGAAIEGSQRAQDLDMKLSWLRSRQGDRVVTLATATPIANSITETYVMQKLARPDLLDAAGVVDFDSWAATFGQLTSSVEMTPDAAGFRVKERFAKFVNVPELLRLWHVSADIKTAADLALPTPQLPARSDGVRAPETVLIAPSPELEAFVADLGERAEKIRGGGVDPSRDNMLKISSEGRAAALDLRLLPGRLEPDTTVSGPGVTPEVSDPGVVPETKLAAAAEKITEIWAEHRGDTFARPDGTPHPTPGALQIVFCDLGTPSATRWNVYDALREELLARGMPREAVRFMHEATTDTAKGELFAAARSGQVAVLMGSTERMGVGTNVQNRAVALHHLDCPWRPADLHQREGRILRQGNQYDEAQILRYVTEGSFDGYSYQTVERKSRFIDQVMHGRLDVREIEDVGDATLSYDEVKALASGDPRVLEKAQIDADVARLERLERGHYRGQSQLDATIATRTEQLTRGHAEHDALDAAITARRATRGAAFAGEIDGTRYTERSDYAAALHAELTRPTGAASGATHTLGELGGLTLTATTSRDPDTHRRRIDLDFAEAPGHPVTVDPHTLDGRPTGVVGSLENRIAGLDRRRDQLQSTLETAEQEIERARAQLGVPFARADELATARARAGQLRHAMTDLAVKSTPAANDPQPDPTRRQSEAGPSSPGGAGPPTPGAAPKPPSATHHQLATEAQTGHAPDDDGLAELRRVAREVQNARAARHPAPTRDPAADPRPSRRLTAEFDREATLDDEIATHRRGHQAPHLGPPQPERDLDAGPEVEGSL